MPKYPVEANARPWLISAECDDPPSCAGHLPPGCGVRSPVRYEINEFMELDFDTEASQHSHRDRA